MSAWNLAKKVAWATFPIGGLIMEGVDKASMAVNAASDQGLEKLSEELAKQELRLKFELQQARIAQELAIAQRILNAELVEIEEFYDLSGSGKAGLSATSETVTLGVGVEGKRVTKRIYQFRGGQMKIENESPDGAGSQPAVLIDNAPSIP